MAALPADPTVVHRLPRRRWRAAPLLAAAAGVLWLHAGLIELLAPGAPPRGLALPAPSTVRVHTVPMPRLTAQAPAVRMATPPLPPVRPVAGPAQPAQLRASADPTRATPRVAPEVVAEVVPEVVAQAAPAARPPDAPAARPPGDGAAGGAADALADAESGGPPVPPPLYATRAPEPVRLHYALRYNGQAGEAWLSWRHDGQRYSLVLDGAGVAGRPLVAQSSVGTLDANGLAPERHLDRRRGARQLAANFRRDTGRISFSGPAVDHPAWPGAQDRLSWLAQLAAILAAGDAPPELQLFVVDARGGASLWRLRHLGDEPGATPSGEARLALWQREPPRPEGLRVQAWLSAERGHWPVRLRFTALRSGDVFELQLLAEPTPPP